MLDYTKADWIKRASGLILRHQAFIGGKFVDAASGETFQSINPATDAVLADVAACDVEDVNRAVASGRAAFEAGVWSRTDPAHRKAVLLKLADLIRHGCSHDRRSWISSLLSVVRRSHRQNLR